MSVSAKYNIKAEVKGVQFVRTIIDWDNQTIIYQYNGKSAIIKINQGKFTALKNILKPDIESIPDISDVEFIF